MQNSHADKSRRRRIRSLWRIDRAGDQSDITVPVHLAYCGIVSTLRHHVTSKTSHLAVLKVAAPDALDSYVEAGRLFLRQVLSRRGYPDPFVREIDPRKNGKTSELAIYRRAAENGKGILLCVSLDDVDEELRLFADVVAVVPKPTSRQINATFRRFGHVLTKSEEQLIAAETWTRLVYAFQPDRPVLAGLRRLRDTSGRTPVPKMAQPPVGPTLADLSGLGPAKEWGLELARDLADFRSGLIPWEDVDSGVLISGPPGTGKTLFAQALSLTCDLPIVTASAAQWQAEGYLNDLLKAMRDSFREARAHGTSILFVDELDAIGSRAINDSQHADYKRQVINGLLELLDGFDRRSGVVVVGATNHPENLDPAILRPGRFDRHFVIPLPDARTRKQIFQFHAGFPVPAEHEELFDRSTGGLSGAGIKQLVRDGRRLARRQRTMFGFEHIVAATKPLVDLPIEHMRVAAFHEAGHAIVGLELGMELEGISITDKVVAEGVQTLGGASFIKETFPLKTRSFYLNHVAMYLGGLAAETMVFGDFTETVAGDPLSDLGVATTLATKVEACFGLGGTLAIDIVHERDLGRLRANDVRLRAAVSEILDKQFLRAKAILDLRISALHEVADTLLDARSMSANDVRDAIIRNRAVGEGQCKPDFEDVEASNHSFGGGLDEIGFHPLGHRIPVWKRSPRPKLPEDTVEDDR